MTSGDEYIEDMDTAEFCRDVLSASERDIIDEELDFLSASETRKRYEEKKRHAIAGRLLKENNMADSSVIMPRYYGDLLTWSLHQHIERDGWTITQTIGFSCERPVYLDVDTGRGQVLNLLRDGTMIIEKDEYRFSVTVDIDLVRSNSVVLTGSANRKEQADRFTDSVKTIAQEENLYRGQKIELLRRIKFLNLSQKMWSSLILDETFKQDIWVNTIGFLDTRDRLKRYNVPIKRGILLVGEPGTGKTLTCKALMAAASGITCIVTCSDAIEDPSCIKELYELAADLSPSIVLIEDIDLIAQERSFRGSALLTLLSVLDGVEERDGVITIATTNCQDTLDKAIAKRPSRFDRIIHYPKPSLPLRGQLISNLCHGIPLPEDIQKYIAHRTDGFTPAQIQEVIYTLSIEHCQKYAASQDMPDDIDCNPEQAESAIQKINARAERPLGFTIADGSNCQRMGTAIPMHNEFTKQDERRQVND